MNQRHFLALATIKGLSTSQLTSAVNHLSSIDALFDLDHNALEALGLPIRIISAIQSVDWHEVDKIQNWSKLSKHHHLITYLDDAYPKLLKEIPDPPPLVICNRRYKPIKLSKYCNGR